jgi:hypothetical protein
LQEVKKLSEFARWTPEVIDLLNEEMLPAMVQPQWN